MATLRGSTFNKLRKALNRFHCLN
uniref:Uncharacterized protein n=1 Tax=Rhizophora mucronata TaxID=61149 RepID=A0A2P2Q473_RHIMU